MKRIFAAAICAGFAITGSAPSASSAPIVTYNLEAQDTVIGQSTSIHFEYRGGNGCQIGDTFCVEIYQTSFITATTVGPFEVFLTPCLLYPNGICGDIFFSPSIVGQNNAEFTFEWWEYEYFSFNEPGFPNLNFPGFGYLDNYRFEGLIKVAGIGVAPVPIPAALPLLLSALGFFGFMGWRRKKAIEA